MEINQLSGVIVDAAMKVHSGLGPGLLERPYHACLKHELDDRGLKTHTALYQERTLSELVGYTQIFNKLRRPKIFGRLTFN